MDELIISYDYGYSNWYVSEFYKYFHQKLINNSNIRLKFIPLCDFAKHFGKEQTNHDTSIFNWYNLILYNPKTEKFFIHSWYDYATEILEYSIKNSFNLVKFSCVSNLSDEIIEKYKDKIVVQPSVYYLENWSDIEHINVLKQKNNKINKAFFNGLKYGHRERIIDVLSKHSFFNIKVKTNPEEYQTKNQYYDELSNHKFGLSLNGAANICYRDLELFGLGVINLRQPLKSKTFNPLIKGIHFLEFLDDELFRLIIHDENVDKIIDSQIERILDTTSQNSLDYMVKESMDWFNKNCLPENQFQIINSFLQEFEILK